jgi:hypothetical protein
MFSRQLQDGSSILSGNLKQESIETEPQNNENNDDED